MRRWVLLLTVFVLMAVVFLSFKGGLIALVSNSIPILINYGIMGWFAIPLDTTTCMVALVAFGIAIDDTIHFMVRYQRELRTTKDPRHAMARTIRQEGEPVMLTSLALALGFGTLVLSSFVPSIHFGLLSAVVMLCALLTDLYFNPVLLTATQLITLWDYVTVRFKKTVLDTSQVFKGLSHSAAKKVVLLGSLQKVARGELACCQGEPGEAMFLVLSGKLDVALDRHPGPSKQIQEIGSGDLFGEMALLGEGIRSASVVARTDCELLRIDYHSMERVSRRNPYIAARLYRNIAHILSDRVRLQNVGREGTCDLK